MAKRKGPEGPARLNRTTRGTEYEHVGCERHPWASSHTFSLTANQGRAAAGALSQYIDAPRTRVERTIAIFVTDGSDPELMDALSRKTEAEKARIEMVAAGISGVEWANGRLLMADHFLAGVPAPFFDAIAIDPLATHLDKLLEMTHAVDCLRMALIHLQVLGDSMEADPLLPADPIDPTRNLVVRLDPARERFRQRRETTTRLANRITDPVVRPRKGGFQRC